MTENEVATLVVDAAYRVHTALGPGLLESVYVADLLIVEVKSTETTHPVHKKQLLTYLRLTGKRLGLLVNFGLPLLKDGVTRVVNALPE